MAGKRMAVAAFKRPSEADSTKWVVSEYFATDWAPDDAPRRPLAGRRSTCLARSTSGPAARA